MEIFADYFYFLAPNTGKIAKKLVCSLCMCQNVVVCVDAVDC
jgi:hypothetical protein